MLTILFCRYKMLATLKRFMRVMKYRHWAPALRALAVDRVGSKFFLVCLLSCVFNVPSW